MTRATYAEAVVRQARGILRRHEADEQGCCFWCWYQHNKTVQIRDCGARRWALQKLGGESTV